MVWYWSSIVFYFKRRYISIVGFETNNEISNLIQNGIWWWPSIWNQHFPLVNNLVHPILNDMNDKLFLEGCGGRRFGVVVWCLNRRFCVRYGWFGVRLGRGLKWSIGMMCCGFLNVSLDTHFSYGFLLVIDWKLKINWRCGKCITILVMMVFDGRCLEWNLVHIHFFHCTFSS